jgi:hypothetical protein
LIDIVRGFLEKNEGACFDGETVRDLKKEQKAAGERGWGGAGTRLLLDS